MASITRALLMLTIAAMMLVPMAVSAAAPSDLARHAAQNPAATNRLTAVYVVTVARIRKSAGGSNQSSAVRPTNDALNSTPHGHAARHTNPVTCPTYHRSAPARPRDGHTLSRYSSRRSPDTLSRSSGLSSKRRTCSAHTGGLGSAFLSLISLTRQSLTRQSLTRQSLTPQGDHRIGPSRARRGPQARADADDAQQQDHRNTCQRIDQRLRADHRLQQPSKAERQHGAGQTPRRDDLQSVTDDHPHDGGSRCAERDADADFERTARGRVTHHREQARHRQHDANRAQSPEQHRRDSHRHH